MVSNKGLTLSDRLARSLGMTAAAALPLFIGAVILFFVAYNYLVIDVPAGHVAVLIRLTGQDLKNSDEIAPDVSIVGAKHKGVQRELLGEGRYILQYNPYVWDWEIHKQFEVPEGKLGVRTRLVGDDLPYGEFLARAENQKGIVPEVLKPGRYAINPYVETVELYEPVNVPAGFRGVVTNLAAPIPSKPSDYDTSVSLGTSKQLLVKPGFRGVLRETLDAGTYYLNPYEIRVNLVDCRSQRFNLAENRDMGFPSKDGFWVSLDGVVEFRVRPESAPLVYVIYNEFANGMRVDEELVKKVILPTARSFCRLQGSNNLGREFIAGNTRSEFQEAFQIALRHECEPMGIEIRQALITSIRPPEQIAKPVREREIAKQKEKQYQQQILQQKSEQQLAMEKELVSQKQALVSASQDVIKVTTEAKQKQEVSVTKAEEQLAVSKLTLDAAKDEAAAVLSRGKAEAEIVTLKNKAESSGWKRSVESFGNNGSQFAQYVMYTKLAPAYRSMMINTADSPIMKIFESFESGRGGSSKSREQTPAATAKTSSETPDVTRPVSSNP